MLVVLLALAGIYYLIWRVAVGPSWNRLYLEPRTLIPFTALGWKVLAASLVGLACEEPWMAWTGMALGLAIVAFTVHRARWNAAVWVIAAAVVSVSLASTGLSQTRTSALGLLIPVSSYRYYPDVMATAVIFAGIAWHFALEAPRSTDGGAAASKRLWSGWRRVAIAGIVMGLMAARSLHTYRKLAPIPHAPVHAYMSELRRSLTALRTSSVPPRLQDGRVPAPLSGLGPVYSRHSVLLKALGVPFVLMKPGPGVYRISPRGALEPSWPVRHAVVRK